ncbi:MAG: sensory rhodopsin transducer [Actinobacteria bacterium]|nr:sensory rhodopsin transducer [Actinomycetota bacterium]
MKEYGSKIWFIPDGEIPDPNAGELYSHEAIIILNPNKEVADIEFTFYFRNEEPIRNIKIKLEAERMIDLHLNNLKEISVNIEVLKPYSVKIDSNIGIIVQHSRLLSLKDNFSIFTTMAYKE